MSEKTVKTLKNAVMLLLVLCLLPAFARAEDPLGVGEVRTPYEVDLDGDGQKETVAIMDVLHEDGDAYMGIEVKKGSVRVRKETDIAVQEALFLDDLDGDGLPELIFSGDECSDDYLTYCWKYTEGQLVPIPFESGEVLNGGVISAQNGRLETFATVNALGTYTGYKDYRYEDGVMTGYSDEWLIGVEEIYVPELTVKEDIYVLAGSGDEGDFGEETILEAGTKIYLGCTDGESWVSYWTDGGAEGVILLEEDEWGSHTFVNGMPEEEVFEGIEYAD